MRESSHGSISWNDVMGNLGLTPSIDLPQVNAVRTDDYDIIGHNESARWRNMMHNMGLAPTPEAIACANRWWNDARPVDQYRRAIVACLQAPNGHTPLLGLGSTGELNQAIRLAASGLQKANELLFEKKVAEIQEMLRRYREIELILRQLFGAPSSSNDLTDIPSLIDEQEGLCIQLYGNPHNQVFLRAAITLGRIKDLCE